LVEDSSGSWGMWECHCAGDELVVVIAGVAIFIPDVEGEPVRTRLTSGQPC
jgi:uncharacterized cupin superfamily protein